MLEMTKEDFIVEMNLQKERGNKLLKQVQQMHVPKIITVTAWQFSVQFPCITRLKKSWNL